MHHKIWILLKQCMKTQDNKAAIAKSIIGHQRGHRETINIYIDIRGSNISHTKNV